MFCQTNNTQNMERKDGKNDTGDPGRNHQFDFQFYSFLIDEYRLEWYHDCNAWYCRRRRLHGKQGIAASLMRYIMV